MFITVLDHYNSDLLCIRVPQAREDDIITEYEDNIDNIVEAAGYNGCAYMVSDFRPKNVKKVTEYDDIFKKLKVGDKVTWYDPDEKVNRVFTVTKRSTEDSVFVSDEYTETEIYDKELKLYKE